VSENPDKPVASSPDRHSFQGKNEDGDWKDMWEAIRKSEEDKLKDPEWQKDNMEYDLRTTEWILEKVRGDDVYAQNLYAAMCNNDFMKLAVMPILKNQTWSCSWRRAGGIIADMREQGDYIDWYCSGIRNEPTPEELAECTEEQLAHYKTTQAYVGESVVTEEIRKDLQTLGWAVIEEEKNEY
jgi:hypothetical protein